MLGAAVHCIVRDGNVITVPDVEAEMVANPEVLALMVITAAPEEEVVAVVAESVGVIDPGAAT
jgi:hypothetical protein